MRYIYTFLIMFGFWILLSGKFDMFHLVLGVISSALVSFMSADVLMHETGKSSKLATAFRFIAYTPWLLYQIVVSTIHVAFLALHPEVKKQIDPTIVTFKTKLKTNVARVALANSITLTPGTLTTDVRDDHFMVHSLSPDGIDELRKGEMEKQIQRLAGRLFHGPTASIAGPASGRNRRRWRCGSKEIRAGRRQARAGDGALGLEPFRLLLNDRRFVGRPMVLETPKGEDLAEDRENLSVLRSLVRREKSRKPS